MLNTMIFQPINSWAIRWLKKNLPQEWSHVWISDEWPEIQDNPKNEFIVLTDTGGYRIDEVSQNRGIGISLSASTKTRADELAGIICALFEVAHTDPKIPVCALDSLTTPQAVANDKTYPHLRHIAGAFIITGKPRNTTVKGE